MNNYKVAGSAVALVVIQAVLELLIRRRTLKRSDLEYVIARLTMQARRRSGTEIAAASEVGADLLRTWLIEAGDEPPRLKRTNLRLVRADE